MTKRQESLLRWLDNWGPFETELALTQTAARAMSASGDELDWLAKEWRQQQLDLDEEPTTEEEPMPEPAEPVGELVPVDTDTAAFTLDQRRAKAYAESGYWPDAASIAKALVKIEAGRALGLPAIVAMSEVHVIEGKPTLGAGALSTLVKASARYNYMVVELTDEKCVLRFYDRGEAVGESVFTMDDAKTANLAGRNTWKQYPRNMLFARAMSNGVAWFAPDAVGGRFYVDDELAEAEPVSQDVVEGEVVEAPA